MHAFQVQLEHMAAWLITSGPGALVVSSITAASKLARDRSLSAYLQYSAVDIHNAQGASCIKHNGLIHPSRLIYTRCSCLSSRQAAVPGKVISRVMARVIAVPNFFMELADLRLQLLACHVNFHVLSHQCFVLLLQLLQCPAICFLRELPLFVDAVSLLGQLVYVKF